MSDYIPTIMKCPSCGRTNGVPTIGGEFECMFCGALMRTPTAGASPQARYGSAPPPASPLSSPFPAYTSAPAILYSPGEPLEEAFPWRKTRGSAGGYLIAILIGAFMVFVGLSAGYLTDPFSSLPGILYTVMVVVLFYNGLTGMLNVSRLRLDGQQLTLRVGPLPWPRRRSWPSQEIESLLVTTFSQKSSRIFSLMVAFKNGRKATLLSGFRQDAPLNSLAARMNSYLDRYVR